MIGSLTRTLVKPHRWLEVTVFFVVFLAATSLLPSHLSWIEASDWRLYFQPAAQSLRSPYIGGIYNPPWLFPMIAPLAWLPTQVGAALLASLTLTVLIGYVKSWPKAITLILSAPVLATLCNGQVDILSLLGLIGPTWLSLPLLAVKPQGVFLAALKRLNRKSITFLGIILAISFLIWGFWPFNILGMPGGAKNCALFPWSLIGTVGILIWLKSNPDSRYADALLCLASLAAFPYWSIHSVLPMTALFIKNTESKLVCLVVCLATWVYVLVTQV